MLYTLFASHFQAESQFQLPGLLLPVTASQFMSGGTGVEHDNSEM